MLDYDNEITKFIFYHAYYLNYLIDSDKKVLDFEDDEANDKKLIDKRWYLEDRESNDYI